jgi:hypothetical protein
MPLGKDSSSASEPDSTGTSGGYEWVGARLLVERFQDPCPVLPRGVHITDGAVAEQAAGARRAASALAALFEELLCG